VGSIFLRLTFHKARIPKEIGINAMANPLPSRKEKPSPLPATIEMTDKI